MGAFLFTVAVLVALALVVALRAGARRPPARGFEGEELANEAGAPPPRAAREPEREPERSEAHPEQRTSG